MKRAVTATCPNCGKDTEIDIDEVPAPTEVIRRAIRDEEAFIIHTIKAVRDSHSESLIYQYGFGPGARFYCSDEITFCRGRLIDRSTAQSCFTYPLP